ncbi:hypothetical protein bAD24_III02060 [Burkholderia sp. AD24]|nr:hypothetical protein bAD24_III02060 [Burkholderia sp. AD24]
MPCAKLNLAGAVRNARTGRGLSLYNGITAHNLSQEIPEKTACFALSLASGRLSENVL